MANPGHTAQTWGAVHFPLLALLATNNTNVSEQMKVNFETSKTFRHPATDTLQATVGRLPACIG